MLLPKCCPHHYFSSSPPVTLLLPSWPASPCSGHHLDITNYNATPLSVPTSPSETTVSSHSSSPFLGSQYQQFLDHTRTDKPLFLAPCYCPPPFPTSCPLTQLRFQHCVTSCVDLQHPQPALPSLYSAGKTLSLVQADSPLSPYLHLSS